MAALGGNGRLAIGERGVDVDQYDFGAFGGEFLGDCWVWSERWEVAGERTIVPAPKPTAPPVTIATFPASLPVGEVVTGVVSEVVGALLEPVWVAIAILRRRRFDIRGTMNRMNRKTTFEKE